MLAPVDLVILIDVRANGDLVDFRELRYRILSMAFIPSAEVETVDTGCIIFSVQQRKTSIEDVICVPFGLGISVEVFPQGVVVLNLVRARMEKSIGHCELIPWDYNHVGFVGVLVHLSDDHLE